MATEPIAPAFPARPHAWAFAAAVLVVVALPFLLGAIGRPTFRERLRSVPAAGGDFAWIEEVILDEREPRALDVVVLGTSYLWSAIDTPLLEERLGIHARSIGSNFRGEEMYFILLSELLERRSTKVLVLSMPASRDRRDAPHPYAHRIAGPGYLDLYDGLPLRQRASAFGELLLGTPRHALSLLRPERPTPTKLGVTRGALLKEEAFGATVFADFRPVPPALTADALDGAEVCFANDPPSPLQLHFLRKTIELAEHRGIKIVVANVPNWNDRDPGAPPDVAWATCAPERTDWRALFPGTRLAAVAPRRLFGGLSQAEQEQLFYGSHLNANGARYLTTALLPAIEEALR